MWIGAEKWWHGKVLHSLSSTARQYSPTLDFHVIVSVCEHIIFQKLPHPLLLQHAWAAPGFKGCRHNMIMNYQYEFVIEGINCSQGVNGTSSGDSFPLVIFYWNKRYVCTISLLDKANTIREECCILWRMRTRSWRMEVLKVWKQGGIYICSKTGDNG